MSMIPVINKRRVGIFLTVLVLTETLFILFEANLFQFPTFVTAAKQDENDAARLFLAQLQHPKDCGSARKLLCPLTPPGGFAYLTHKLVNCFIYAAWTNRTVVLYPYRGPIITKEGWERFFLPISENCTSYGKPVPLWGAYHAQHQVVKIVPHYAPAMTPELSGWYEGPPAWIPAPSSVEFPIAWWVGHIIQYIYRLQPSMAEHVRAAKENIGFVEPIPGMQVRRTDKLIKEAEFRPVEAYMLSIERYYDNRKKGTVKRVYLATDEPEVVTELQTKYPDYTFLSDNTTILGANDVSEASRFSSDIHVGILTDIQLLLSCEFVVCTLTSNICRTIYEVQSSRMWNVSETLHSVDITYTRYW